MALDVAAFASIYVTDPSRRINTTTDIDLTAAFNQVAACDASNNLTNACRFAISKALNDALTGLDTALHRNRLITGRMADIPEVNTIAKLSTAKLLHGRLTEAETAEYGKALQFLSTKSGLDPELLQHIAGEKFMSNAVLEELRKELRTINNEDTKKEMYDGLLDEFYPDSGDKENAPEDVKEKLKAIAGVFAKLLIGEDMTPEEQAMYDENVALLLEATGKTREEFDKIVTDAQEVFFDGIHKAIKESLAQELADDAIGVQYDGADGKRHISLALPDQNIIARLEKSFGIGNVPKIIPGNNVLSSELFTFLTDLHEAEHTKNKTYPWLSKDLQTLSNEIDSDLAVMRFLNSGRNEEEKAQFSEIKEFWLRNRHVRSFGGDLDHDTATFIRVLEATGEQIDIQQFRAEKESLLKKLETKLGRVPENSSIESTMGAAEVLLKEHEQEMKNREQGLPPDESKLLSPIQLAECRSYLENAKALGYTPNPNYGPGAQIAQNSEPAPKAMAAGAP